MKDEGAIDYASVGRRKCRAGALLVDRKAA